MKNKVMFAAAFSVAGLSLGATTLVHYPMDNMEKKSYAAGATIADMSPSGAHPATLAEYVYGTHAYFAPAVETPAGLPANAIRDGQSQTTLRNNAVLTFTQPNDNVDGNGAELRIEEAAEDTSLHLQTFTIEFLWKCAVPKSRWAAPLSRARVDPANPPVVKTGEEATTLTMYISNAEGRPVNCIVATQTGSGLSVTTVGLGSSASIVDGNWHHIALTLDGATHVLTLYVDGTANGSVTLDGDLVYQDANPWCFGGHGYFGWQAGGSMDEIRISDCVLAPSEFLSFATQPDVLARYSMDATPETSFAIGDTFPNRADAAATPLTVCNAVHPAYVDKYPAGDAVFYPPKAAAFSAPLDAVQDGRIGLVETNATALAFTQPTATGKDGWGATLQVKDDDDTFHLQEFTIEYFWNVCFSLHWAAPLSRTRVDAAGNPLGTTGDLGKDASTLTFYLIDSLDEFRCMYAVQTAAGIVAEDKLICSDYKALFNDNAWHHHAVTLNAHTHQLTYYVDGNVIGAITLPGPLVYAPGNAWSFGGYGYFGWQAGGSMDEIRISPFVCAPETFLRPAFSTPAKGALAYFALDGDVKSFVNPALNPDDAAVAAIVNPLIQSGNLAFGTDVPGARITDRADNPIRPKNLTSLTVSGLKDGLVLPASTYRFGRSNGFTCEFFAKATLDDIKKGAWAVLFAWRDAVAANNRYPICFQEDGNGMLSCRMDTDKDTMHQAMKSKASPFDGNWHHIACTAQPATGNQQPTTVFCFYIDGELQDAKTSPGMVPDLRNASFEIGTRANAMKIDEIRISNGVLDVSDFLLPRPPSGMAILVR